MKEYYLNLVGLRFVLRTPYEITLSENLRPFLCPPNNNTDCIIELTPCASLPPFSESGVWHGMEYYDEKNGEKRIFHCIGPEKKAFAVTRLINQNITLSVLPDYLSYFTGSSGILNRIGLETMLLQHEGLLLHASLIKYQNRAIAFAGPSGIGKSTQAQLWQRQENAEILNGDRCALRKEEGLWTAYGSPYAGTSGIYRQDGGPLTAIVFLKQSSKNRLLPLPKEEAFKRFYPELSLHHWDRNFMEKAMDLSLQLLSEIPVYLLECTPEKEAVDLLKKGLGL